MSGSLRALVPREHGAYFELGFPLLSGLTVVAPTVASTAIAAAAVLLFLSHESLAVLSGMRGRRVRDAASVRAPRTFGVLATGGVLAGLTGMLLADPTARLSTLVPIAFAGLLAPWVIRRRQKSLPAELLVVAVFATLVLPIGLAGGMSWPVAGIVSTVWLASFVPGTFAVHALKLHHKGRPAATPLRAAGIGVALGVVGGAAIAASVGLLPSIAAVAVLPPAGAAIALSIRPVHPRNLKRVGWTLVSASVLTWICLLFL